MRERGEERRRHTSRDSDSIAWSNPKDPCADAPAEALEALLLQDRPHRLKRVPIPLRIVSAQHLECWLGGMGEGERVGEGWKEGSEGMEGIRRGKRVKGEYT